MSLETKIADLAQVIATDIKAIKQNAVQANNNVQQQIAAVTIAVGPTPPASPAQGQLWVQTT